MANLKRKATSTDGIASVPCREHPLPTPDEGKRIVTLGTDLTSIDIPDIAAILMRVNTKATDTFFESLRRSVSIFERPLVTARDDGRSYVYSSASGRYAQALATAFRVWYNWCHVFGEKGDKKTPAMRLGLTKRVFTWDDIIYG